jgi:hypothetical protein
LPGSLLARLRGVRVRGSAPRLSAVLGRLRIIPGILTAVFQVFSKFVHTVLNFANTVCDLSLCKGSY